MTVEAATYVGDLDASKPSVGDPRSEGDDHLRLLKAALQATWPGAAGRFGRYQAKSTNYTAVLNDAFSVLKFSAAATLSLTLAATLGNGWELDINAAGGAVVVDPATTELVNGAATFTIPRGAVARLVCDSTGFDCYFLSELPGTLKDFAGETVPGGYLPCDGSAVSRTTYAALFAAIGVTWGAGDGASTFNVPNLNRRVTVGSGGSGTATLANTVGATGGAETHALTSDELAAHTHSTPNHTHTTSDPQHQHSSVTTSEQGASGGGNGFLVQNGVTGNASTGISINSSGGGTSGSTGSGTAHNTMQPSAVVTKIIKV